MRKLASKSIETAWDHMFHGLSYDCPYCQPSFMAAKFYCEELACRLNVETERRIMYFEALEKQRIAEEMDGLGLA
jgi:hypothetical protein